MVVFFYKNIKLFVFIFGILILGTNSAFSEVEIIGSHYGRPISEVLGGRTYVGKSDTLNKLNFINEKPYAVSAEILDSEHNIIKRLVLPPRPDGPISNAIDFLKDPITGTIKIWNGDFGRSKVEYDLSGKSSEGIGSITIVGGTTQANNANAAYLMISTAVIIKNSIYESVSSNPNANKLKDILDFSFKKVVDKLQSPNNISTIVGLASNGCEVTECLNVAKGITVSILKEIALELTTNIAYKEALSVIKIDPLEASNILLDKLVVMQALSIMSIVEKAGNMAGLLSGMVRYPNREGISVFSFENSNNPKDNGSPNNPRNPPTNPDRTPDLPPNRRPSPFVSSWDGAYSIVGGGSSSYEGARTKGNGNTVIKKNGPSVEIEKGSRLNKNFSTGRGDFFGNYSYTAWGAWTGNGHVYTNYAGDSVNVDHGHWVMGAVTKDLPRSGSANYSGDVRGDFISAGAGTIERNAISGNVSLNANFGSKRISGSMNLKKNGSSWATTSFSGIRIESYNAYSGSMNVSGGGRGGIYGTFYGPNAEETGGGFYVDKQSGDGGGASGVFRAKK